MSGCTATAILPEYPKEFERRQHNSYNDHPADRSGAALEGKAYADERPRNVSETKNEAVQPEYLTVERENREGKERVESDNQKLECVRLDQIKSEERVDPDNQQKTNPRLYKATVETDPEKGDNCKDRTPLPLLSRPRDARRLDKERYHHHEEDDPEHDVENPRIELNRHQCAGDRTDKRRYQHRNRIPHDKDVLPTKTRSTSGTLHHYGDAVGPVRDRCGNTGKEQCRDCQERPASREGVDKPRGNSRSEDDRQLE